MLFLQMCAAFISAYILVLQIGIFFAAVIIIFVVRFALEVTVTFMPADNELLFRSIEMLGHAVPELGMFSVTTATT